LTGTGRPLLARDIMSGPAITIGTDMTVGEAAAVMLKHNFGSLPVVDGSGRFAGLMTERVFLPSEKAYPFMRGTTMTLLGRAMGGTENMEEVVREVCNQPVGEVMETDVPTAGEDTPAAELAETMVRDHIHHIPVVRDGVPMGMVSWHDFLRIFVEAM